MDIATIVKEVRGTGRDAVPIYHIRLSKRAKGPQTSAGEKVLEILQRKDGETIEEFTERAKRYVQQLPDED